MAELRGDEPKNNHTMAVKKFNPITPGTRYRVGSSFAEVTTDTPEKSLLAPLKKSGGRNNSGRRTMRHIGGGQNAATGSSTSNATGMAFLRR